MDQLALIIGLLLATVVAVGLCLPVSWPSGHRLLP
ncbi:hypothetical protein ABIB27_002895 [Arthrobacter sp. UYEF21]